MLLSQLALAHGVEAHLVIKQYKYRDRGPFSWFTDSLAIAAFWVNNTAQVQVRIIHLGLMAESYDLL